MAFFKFTTLWQKKGIVKDKLMVNALMFGGKSAHGPSMKMPTANGKAIAVSKLDAILKRQMEKARQDLIFTHQFHAGF